MLNYLESYIFKLDDSIYNYSDFFKYIKINDNNDNNIINTFYVTNNIVESINSKIKTHIFQNIQLIILILLILSIKY